MTRIEYMPFFAVRALGWTVAVLALVGVSPVVASAQVMRPASVPEGSQLLSHVGDSTNDSASLPGSGHIVQFQRSEEADALVAVRIYARRTGTERSPRDRFRVVILDEEKQVIEEVGIPYVAVMAGTELRWYTLKMPGIMVPSRFSVALDFNPNESRGIDLGKASGGSNSQIGLPGQMEFEAADGEWMVHAWLLPSMDYDDAEASANLSGEGLLGYVADTSSTERSLYRSGHIVSFQRPEDLGIVSQVQLYGNRYGYDTPPSESFTVSLLDEDRRLIKEFPFPYSTIEKLEGMEWRNLDIKPTPVPEVFYVAVSFDPTPTRGVLVGLDDSIYTPHSYEGLADGMFEPLVVGDWMIRVKMSESAVATGAKKASSAMTAVKGEKLSEPVEREFRDGVSSFNSFLDLDFDEIVPVPASLQQSKDSAAWMKWANTNGVDVRFRVQGGRCLFGQIEACVIPYSNDRWEKASPAGIRSYAALMRGELAMTNLTVDDAEMPMTYLIRTREGGLGVLQLLGFDAGYTTVKVRYKMVTVGESFEMMGDDGGVIDGGDFFE